MNIIKPRELAYKNPAELRDWKERIETAMKETGGESNTANFLRKLAIYAIETEISARCGRDTVTAEAAA